jgi:hypothetical protein
MIVGVFFEKEWPAAARISASWPLTIGCIRPEPLLAAP